MYIEDGDPIGCVYRAVSPMGCVCALYGVYIGDFSPIGCVYRAVCPIGCVYGGCVSYRVCV